MKSDIRASDRVSASGAFSPQSTSRAGIESIMRLLRRYKRHLDAFKDVSEQTS